MDSFFFQAEDGIRDDLVTGVQTCALPISQALEWAKAAAARDLESVFSRSLAAAAFAHSSAWARIALSSAARVSSGGAEIGRASCRARVSAAGGTTTLGI